MGTCGSAHALEHQSMRGHSWAPLQANDAVRTRFTVDLIAPQLANAAELTGLARLTARTPCAFSEEIARMTWFSVTPPHAATALRLSTCAPHALEWVFTLVHGECNAAQHLLSCSGTLDADGAHEAGPSSPCTERLVTKLPASPLFLVAWPPARNATSKVTLHVQYDVIDTQHMHIASEAAARIGLGAARSLPSESVVGGAALLLFVLLCTAAQCCERPLRRRLLASAFVAWISLRVERVGGLLFVSVPLVGFLRVDVALLSLLFEAVLGALLHKLHRRLALTLALVAILVARFAPLTWYSTRGVLAELPSLDASVHEMVEMLPVRTIEQLAASVLESRPYWTLAHVAHGLPILPYFSLGVNSNHADDDESARPFWSQAYGFRALPGNFGGRALGVDGRVHRETSRAFMRAATWLQAPLRTALAAAVGVPRERVVFGGEGAISHLRAPAAQIYLPNVVWAMLLNPHTDALQRQQLQRVEGEPCNGSTRTAFLLPLLTPPGTGLSWWKVSADGEVVRHQTMYTRGSLYSWPLTLKHALKPWPYAEWDISATRMTMQAFGVRCGASWYFYH
ncbi:hypothetical protein EMIHUDRAFT_244584 [Emiliania huxleyi CCMP1516]|uniref:Mannosyltransferase n=2 Tax=Emiliania huxleyi TaxID=2903 RepID=A0A0D3J0H4_EMIH1|nr:hypothetical protein EMIHUDRAFT_244584 [Emiliania huxleyi CCMP1516]EOD17009.1 hypothetical protein EMIHUDRAFT_244584 [Emiliania huxleyi CCMP1516]|eukprot:XP_005769438.1 hypothetical protein EMIHUDRAFT_244584 [Emiliania huxleyi CCMP1516]